jgi:hypothetical protein
MAMVTGYKTPFERNDYNRDIKFHRAHRNLNLGIISSSEYTELLDKYRQDHRKKEDELLLGL